MTSIPTKDVNQTSEFPPSCVAFIISESRNVAAYHCKTSCNCPGNHDFGRRAWPSRKIVIGMWLKKKHKKAARVFPVSVNMKIIYPIFGPKPKAICPARRSVQLEESAIS
mmetsp:Transcript_38048/g.91045  ORF Transcript_38048/g.91045 Transcript_38048/m.91045 type:complete len:110 (+) Transcript_38048:364-693(+)